MKEDRLQVEEEEDGEEAGGSGGQHQGLGGRGRGHVRLQRSCTEKKIYAQDDQLL